MEDKKVILLIRVEISEIELLSIPEIMAIARQMGQATLLDMKTVEIEKH